MQQISHLFLIFFFCAYVCKNKNEFQMKNFPFSLKALSRLTGCKYHRLRNIDEGKKPTEAEKEKTVLVVEKGLRGFLKDPSITITSDSDKENDSK